MFNLKKSCKSSLIGLDQSENFKTVFLCVTKSFLNWVCFLYGCPKVKPLIRLLCLLSVTFNK